MDLSNLSIVVSSALGACEEVPPMDSPAFFCPCAGCCLLAGHGAGVHGGGGGKWWGGHRAAARACKDALSHESWSVQLHA